MKPDRSLVNETGHLDLLATECFLSYAWHMPRMQIISEQHGSIREFDHIFITSLR
jgi:hypothetical protein